MIPSQTFQELCIRVARQLARLSGEADTNQNPETLYTHLIFPKYKHETEGKNRISEQEARILFCKELEQNYPNIYFSIETPTEKKYSFGKSINRIKVDNNGRSTSSDITLYKMEKSRFKQQVNIELKAHNVEFFNIAKDFFKLLSEPYNGLFFHTLESVDNGTLTTNRKHKGILIKYKEAIRKLEKQIKALHLKDDEQFILFCICSLNPKFLLIKKIFKFNLVKSFSSISFQYKIKDNHIKIIDKDGWEFKKL